MNPYDVLIRPVLSEKSNKVREDVGTYTFRIQSNATKSDVKRAVSRLFDVKVEKVQTLITRGKIRRRGMHFGKPSKSKKAIVKLAQGEKINIFEDQ